MPPELNTALGTLIKQQKRTEEFIESIERSISAARSNFTDNIVAGRPGNSESLSHVISGGEQLIIQSYKSLDKIKAEIAELTKIANFKRKQNAVAAAKAAAAKLKEEQNAAAALAAAKLEEEKVAAYEKQNPSFLAGVLSSVPPSVKPTDSITSGGRRRNRKTRRSKKSRKQTRRRR